MKSVFLLALAAASALGDYTDVITQVRAIQAKVKDLTGSINSFEGGNASTVQALGIEFATLDINKMVKNATTTANASAYFGDDGSNAVGRAILLLQPDLYSSLDAIVAKHDAFAKPLIFGIKPTAFVLPDLKMLKKSTDGFGAAVVAKLNPPLKAFAPSIVQDIDEHFDAAIAAYS